MLIIFLQNLFNRLDAQARPNPFDLGEYEGNTTVPVIIYYLTLPTEHLRSDGYFDAPTAPPGAADNALSSILRNFIAGRVYYTFCFI